MQFTIFHLISFVILILCFTLICFVVLLKVKDKIIALVINTVAFMITAIVIYSVFMTIYEITTQAELSRLTYTRILKNESLLVRGRVTNLTKFDIRKCYLHLNITNKRHVGGEVFENKNLKTATMENTSANYTIEIASQLPGKTYEDFSVEVPFPPSFTLPEFYHTLECK